ncbi:c-type cytochrome [Microvirgula aerodenitrificans]|uniref:c-type cytochrome n=1 Tax=Microvirgula aerodenitrificans TaxID=57480 RepID=UPI001F2E849C|nr:c-type cytochrome [Microvirgula aerodenitrificans]
MSSENSTMAPGSVIRVLVAVVALVVVAIWLLAKLATSGQIVNAEVMSNEAVAARLKPVGESVASDAAPGMRTGEQVYKAVCISCHGTALAGSPKFGDAGAWAARIAQGYDTLVTHALNGLNAMPAKGGATDLSDDEIKRAVAFMGNAAGGKFTEPPVGGGKPAPHWIRKWPARRSTTASAWPAMLPAPPAHRSSVTRQPGHRV